MGKRSDFPRLPQDAYSTPAEAVVPLLRRLTPRTRFIEPCAGAGRLIEHLESAGHVCAGRCDLPCDATVAHYDVEGADYFITNPPWRRDVLHPIIVNLSDQLPTWLLIEFGLGAHASIGAVPIAPQGDRQRRTSPLDSRLANSPYDGKDNCAWHLFSRPEFDVVTRFFGRTGRTDTARMAA